MEFWLAWHLDLYPFAVVNGSSDFYFGSTASGHLFPFVPMLSRRLVPCLGLDSKSSATSSMIGTVGQWEDKAFICLCY